MLWFGRPNEKGDWGQAVWIVKKYWASYQSSSCHKIGQWICEQEPAQPYILVHYFVTLYYFNLGKLDAVLAVCLSGPQ